MTAIQPTVELCQICGRSAHESGRESLCDDHDHQTGKPRGRLCNECNVGLGMFRDDPALLERATRYLRDFRRTLGPCRGRPPGEKKDPHVVSAMTDKGPFTIQEACDATGLAYSTVTLQLGNLVESGNVIRISRGLYKVAPFGKRLQIAFATFSGSVTMGP